MSRASTLVKNAAMAMMGTSLLIFPARGAANGSIHQRPEKYRTELPAAVRRPRRIRQCYHDTKIAYYKGRINVAEVRLARAEKGVACARFLLSKKAAGVALDPTRINREKGCAYALELGCN